MRVNFAKNLTGIMQLSRLKARWAHSESMSTLVTATGVSASATDKRPKIWVSPEEDAEATLGADADRAGGSAGALVVSSEGVLRALAAPAVWKAP